MLQQAETPLARNQPITSDDDSNAEMVVKAKQPNTEKPPNSPTEQRRKKMPAIKQPRNKAKKYKEGKKVKRPQPPI